MALNIGDNFRYQGRKANFERDSFATLAEMKTFPETSVDDGHISYCAEGGNHYEFNSSNATDPNTGKWRVFRDISGKVSGVGITSVQVVGSLPDHQADGVLYIVTGEGGV